MNYIMFTLNIMCTVTIICYDRDSVFCLHLIGQSQSLRSTPTMSGRCDWESFTPASDFSDLGFAMARMVNAAWVAIPKLRFMTFGIAA